MNIPTTPPPPSRPVVPNAPRKVRPAESISSNQMGPPPQAPMFSAARKLFE